MEDRLIMREIQEILRRLSLREVNKGRLEWDIRLV